MAPTSAGGKPTGIGSNQIVAIECRWPWTKLPIRFAMFILTARDADATLPERVAPYRKDHVGTFPAGCTRDPTAAGHADEVIE